MNARSTAGWLAVLAWGCVAVASIVAATGPISVDIIGLSISGPARLLGAAALLLVVATRLTGPRLLLHDLASSSAPYLTSVGLAMVLLGALLAAKGSTSVGGADSAGYLAQAARWNAGAARVALPLDIRGLPDAAWRQSALGFRPAPSGEATVPSYPPGLPWLQAAALRTGGEAAAVRALPFIAALAAVVGAYLLARTHAGPPGAAVVAISLAALPPFLFQALQPMSDVPALAGWLLALAVAARASRTAAVASALATLVAILIRPNLAPLALAVCWQAAAARPLALRAAASPAIAAAIAVGLVALVQAALYGSPFHSGYGRAPELFSLAHVPANISRYGTWLAEAVAVPTLVLLALGGASLVLRSARHVATRPMLAMALLTMAIYLVYVPFDSWTYLRFVLPALAILPIGVATLVRDAGERVELSGRLREAPLSGAWRFPAFCALVLVVAVPNLQRARNLGVFEVRSRESRYEAAGRFTRDRLPADAVVVAAQHSASAAYYSGLPLLRADLLDAAALGTVSTWSSREQRPLAFVLDTDEVARVGDRLGGRGLAAFDWPPRAEIGSPVVTRIWLSTDRDAYMAGQAIRTTRIVPTR